MDYTEVVKKFDAILTRGLCEGVGTRDGQMCVEAAICAAMGLPHGDDPKCVAYNVRQFKIALNDCDWSSPEARAKGLRDLGIAQLGSLRVVNNGDFNRLLIEKIIKSLLPDLLDLCSGYPDCLDAAEVCRKEGSAKSAKSAYLATHLALDGAKFDFAGKSEPLYTTESVAEFIVACAINPAISSGYIFNRCFCFPHLKTRQTDDYYLLMAAKLALEVLRELKSPGCEYL